ncbi:hypothetical protein L210DRAFT_3627937 [Boletus edulis BED1]|uniref:Uncharacterized protein n=1 Tax=Boletus edulis BED1 TaxID=1328754 RepID=A0AAD4C316_BOLED|nr:hypothetical protein L210DRAFT_3627937 [Boletus edulis BED1]
MSSMERQWKGWITPVRECRTYEDDSTRTGRSHISVISHKGRLCVDEGKRAWGNGSIRAGLCLCWMWSSFVGPNSLIPSYPARRTRIARQEQVVPRRSGWDKPRCRLGGCSCKRCAFGPMHASDDDESEFHLIELDWSPELWVAYHDVDEQNACLASRVCEGNGFDHAEGMGSAAAIATIPMPGWINPSMSYWATVTTTGHESLDRADS